MQGFWQQWTKQLNATNNLCGVGCGGSIWGCGGSMVLHQAVKSAVPGSNPASLQPVGTFIAC